MQQQDDFRRALLLIHQQHQKLQQQDDFKRALHLIHQHHERQRCRETQVKTHYHTVTQFTASNAENVRWREKDNELRRERKIMKRRLRDLENRYHLGVIFPKAIVNLILKYDGCILLSPHGS